MAYLPKETIVSKKRNNQRRKNKARQAHEETVNMINTLRSEYDHLLASPFLGKKDDPSVPSTKSDRWSTEGYAHGSR